jgi:succinyl-diaminopimelate desuccinylase
MTEREKFERIIKRIDSYEDEMVALQIALTAIPALAPENGGEGEEQKARFLARYLKKAGFKDVREYNAPDDRVPSGIRPNIVATLPGNNADRTVWILTHTDVVPPGELEFWDRDPYECYVNDGKVYGRGTEDNQQDLVASLFATKAFIDEGIIPESNIGLAFVADEETASRKGLEYLLEKHGHLFGNSDIIVVPDFGNEKGSIIEVAEKSILWLRIKTIGKQCHASVPSRGNNAFRAASHLVAKLDELGDIFSQTDPMFTPPESTFEPTKKDANVPNINTIPGEDVFYLDSRILPTYDLKEIKSEIEKIAGVIEDKFDVKVAIDVVQEVQAPSPTPSDATVVNALKSAIKAIYNIDAKPAGIGGGTVAAHFRQKGYPVAVWSKLGSMAHQPNEYCIIDNMVSNAKVYAYLFLI